MNASSTNSFRSELFIMVVSVITFLASTGAGMSANLTREGGLDRHSILFAACLTIDIFCHGIVDYKFIGYNQVI